MSMRAQKDKTLYLDLATFVPHPLSLSYFLPLSLTCVISLRFPLSSLSLSDLDLHPSISPLSLARLTVGKGAG
jgi:hypothetical protein